MMERRGVKRSLTRGEPDAAHHEGGSRAFNWRWECQPIVRDLASSLLPTRSTL